MPKKKDYEVGYGKPPQHTRFKPGESGNPSGRPKRAKSLLRQLHEELDQRVPVMEKGKEKVMAKGRIVLRRLVNMAVNGDIKAIDRIFRSEQLLGSREASGLEPLDKKDREELERYREKDRLLGEICVEDLDEAIEEELKRLASERERYQKFPKEEDLP